MKTSKSVIVALLITFLSVGASHAQGVSHYEKGDLLINGGLSFGYFGYGYRGIRSTSIVPVNLSVEYGVTDDITVGPFIGYARWRYRFQNDSYNWAFTTVGARGTFHGTPLLNELLDGDIDPKIDIYASVLAGLEFRSYSGADGIYDDLDDINIILGPVLGVRYYFSDQFALYIEGGRGAFGVGTLGLSLRL